MVAGIPDSSWQDGTMTSNDHATLLLPEVRPAPPEPCLFPAVVLVEELAAPLDEAQP